jgi:hypothetical protein
MVGILELLSSNHLNGPEVLLPQTETVVPQKGKRYKVKHAHTMNNQNQDQIKNGVGSFGVTSKLKDINKKIKQKALEKEDISNMDPEHIHMQKIEYFKSVQDSLPELRNQLKNETSIKKKKELADKIKSIESREEENEYLFQTMNIIKKMWCENDQSTSDQDQDLVETISGLVLETKESAKNQKWSAMYMQAIDPTVSHSITDLEYEKLKVDDQKCRKCENEELEYDDGELYCMQCGVSQNIKDMNHVSFKESTSKNWVTNPTYKRINHFNEWLNSVTNKSSSVVPESIIQAIRQEMGKDHITDTHDLDKKRVRLYLKRLGQSKYYDSVSSILCKISGQASLEMPEELLAQLRDMFVEIQQPFEKSKPKYRSSFLSYSYTINRMLKLLDYEEYMYAFPLLKSREKLIVQDMIWKGICDILDWRFDPTV